MRALVGGAGQGGGRGRADRLAGQGREVGGAGQTGWRGRAERWAGQGRQVGGAGKGVGGEGQTGCREKKVLFELLADNVAE
jgi:hypothetical protein